MTQFGISEFDLEETHHLVSLPTLQDTGFEDRQTWVQILVLLFISYVKPGRLFSLSES